MSAPVELPLLTAALPGTGGVLRTTPEDFHVEELPVYEPEGQGDHVFACIEKRGLTTSEAARRLAIAVGVEPRDVGWAGMKDRHAVTRQMLSLPPPATPEAASAASSEGLTVLSAVRHPHKLRTGHLRGNRFVLRLRKLAVPADEAAARAEAIFAQLASAPGAPNWFGGQRFGSAGDNAAVGRAILTGEGHIPRSARGRQRRLFISAFQSALFNEYLRDRILSGDFARVWPGDVLQKRVSGGIFVCEDPQHDEPRLHAGEVVPTGPMFGPRMRQPATESVAAMREQAILANNGITLETFRAGGKLSAGTRRPIAVDLGRVTVVMVDGDCIEVGFDLPAGAYATAVMREVIKDVDGFPA